MKKEPFIQIPKELLDHPIIDRLVDKEGAMFLGTYAVLLLYLSRRPNCVGSLNNLTLRLIAMQLHKSVKYVRHVIFDTGLFRADEERNVFTNPNLQRTFGIPETLDNGADAPAAKEEVTVDEAKHPMESEDRSGNPGHGTADGRDGSAGEEVHPSDQGDHPIIEGENPTGAEGGFEGSDTCFATARKPLANAMGIHSGMNHDASVIDSKLNANSIFVRVPYIRARINRDKDKNINLRKKESTSSTQKKNAVVVADEIFNFGFYSFKPTKNGARGGGAGGHVDRGPVTLPTENAKGSEGCDRSPSGPSPPGCRRSSPALRKVIG